MIPSRTEPSGRPRPFVQKGFFLKSLPYFKWYPADADTDQNFRAMDDADIGFYIRCLNHAWVNGGIPADPKERARVLHTRLDTANKRWERVGKCFVTSTSTPDQLINLRQEAERGLAMSKSLKAAESANARYERRANAPVRALARADCVSVSESSVKIPEKEKPSTRATVAADLNGQTSQRFPEFWQRWPRKQHRDAACRLWISVVSVEDEAAVFGCLDRFLASEQAARAIIPNPENWLLQQSRDRWQGDWPARASPAAERKSRQQEQADAWREA